VVLKRCCACLSYDADDADDDDDDDDDIRPRPYLRNALSDTSVCSFNQCSFTAVFGRNKAGKIDI